MAGITLAEAETRLADWLAADAAVSKKQSYTIGDRTLTLADAKEIRENIKFWNDQATGLDTTAKVRSRARKAVI